MLQLPLSLCLVDHPVSEQSSQRRTPRLIDHPLGKPPTVPLNHHQVLSVRVRGEQQIPRQQLHCDAPDRPNVSDLIPLATFHDDLGRPVLPGADDSAVRLVEESCSSEVNDPHLAALGQPVGLVLKLLLD